MSLTILDLLPQNKDSLLKDRNLKLHIINLLLAIYEISMAALEAFSNKQFYLLDAQIGETSCQIRAFKILLLSSGYYQDFNKITLRKELIQLKLFKENLVKFHDQFKEIIIDKGKSYYKYLDAPITIYDFFFEADLIANLSSNTIYIIQCYMLSKYSLRDKEEIPFAIDFNKIKFELSISQAQSKRLVHLYQKSVAKDSCDFVLQLAKHPIIDPTLKQVLPLLKKVAEEERYVLPCYHVTEVLLMNALDKGKPILTIVNRYFKNDFLDTIYLLFSPSKNEQYFAHQEISLKDYSNQPCLVIKGEVAYTKSRQLESKFEYIRRFNALGIFNAVLYNMAKHPQYIGGRLSWLAENPFLCVNKFDLDHEIMLDKLNALEEKLIQDQVLAENYGCCFNNKSLFFLKHVFCDLIGNQISQELSAQPLLNTSQTVLQYEGLLA